MLANLPTDRPMTLLRYDGQNYNNFVIENQCGTPQSIEYHKKLNRLTVYCINAFRRLSAPRETDNHPLCGWGTKGNTKKSPNEVQ